MPCGPKCFRPRSMSSRRICRAARLKKCRVVSTLASPMQPDHRVLEDVVGLLPATDAGMAAEHAASEDEEPVAGMVDELVAGRLVAPARLLDERLQPGFCLGGGARGAHTPLDYPSRPGGRPPR